MKQLLRALTLAVAGVFIVAMGAVGWVGLLDYGAAVFPPIQEFATIRFIRSIGILAGLALLLLPFYTLLYFHQTTDTEVLGFKTPRGNQKPEPSLPANPTPPGTSAAEEPRVPASGGG